ncbi:uncharacterized protein MELLADRAFT_78558 [Melampsora larici-populina 98AG31]|uniref:DNA replication regulator Sld3 C-terminal domain-containing protein n=1 Tax=Melampsora larici-populina (strain 98AG31 / pathotype 3-4-7) TaxID=747676 RepID=F4RVW1_MELLP|nr:uncharacterized protein MELLADRAFT_78558 [Melampsora larici-populina 98AG31]EGG03427.1 hypothetical protein MELLADRAFT_78558 [Melampsora larici-populina 98AG31]
MTELQPIPNYSLAPAFLCPFGWPTDPTYPIDVDASITNTEGASSTNKSDSCTPTANLFQTWADIFELNHSDEDETELTRIYLEALYLPDSYSVNTQSPMITLVQKIKSLSNEYSAEELVEFLESFLISEKLLAKKWDKSVPGYVNYFLPNDNITQPEIEEEEENVFQFNELDVIRAVVDYRHYQSSKPNSSGLDSKTNRYTGKENFTRNESTKQQIETWAAREAQIQIIFLLEIIVLTNQSSNQGSQILTHHTKLLSSPRKPNRQESTKPIDQIEAVSDLEQLLEGLIDRLAMWQLLSDFGSSELSNLFKSSDPSVNKSSHSDLDEAQRFWTDIVEEYYTHQIPLLNSSFRPKLFPTSIYEPTGSSLIPTQFDSSAKHHPLSSITRTPNLKELDRQQGLREAARAAKLSTLSPTLNDNPQKKKRQRLMKNASMSESQLALSHLNSNRLGINSRSLFSRREVSMTHLPFKSKLNHTLHRRNQSLASASGSGNGNKGIWNQKDHRKQSLPRKFPETRILVPDTPHHRRELVPDTPT